MGEIEAVPKREDSREEPGLMRVSRQIGRLRGRMILKYEIVRDEKRIILKEINERADSIRVIPDRLDNKYILPESKLEEENINDDTS